MLPQSLSLKIILTPFFWISLTSFPFLSCFFSTQPVIRGKQKKKKKSLEADKKPFGHICQHIAFKWVIEVKPSVTF